MAAAAAVPAASVDQSGLLQSFDATAAAVTSTSNGATTAVVPTAVAAAAVRRNGGSQVNQPGLLLSTTFWRERVESSSEGVFVELLLRLVCSLCRPFRSSILILLSHSPRKRCNKGLNSMDRLASALTFRAIQSSGWSNAICNRSGFRQSRSRLWHTPQPKKRKIFAAKFSCYFCFRVLFT